mmetsp:Transcript_16220/g.33298  ORF Transcript_16220/g.33298 Transcript_16220/m.33298 type:complete len:216 (-) Transcript_16220:3-650(-)
MSDAQTHSPIGVSLQPDHICGRLYYLSMHLHVGGSRLFAIRQKGHAPNTDGAPNGNTGFSVLSHNIPMDRFSVNVQRCGNEGTETARIQICAGTKDTTRGDCRPCYLVRHGCHDIAGVGNDAYRCVRTVFQHLGNDCLEYAAILFHQVQPSFGWFTCCSCCDHNQPRSSCDGIVGGTDDTNPRVECRSLTQILHFPIKFWTVYVHQGDGARCSTI